MVDMVDDALVKHEVPELVRNGETLTRGRVSAVHPNGSPSAVTDEQPGHVTQISFSDHYSSPAHHRLDRHGRVLAHSVSDE
jgi:hypothetical protein